MSLRLAKAGYGGGDPEKVLEMPADIVMAAVDYETFQSDYALTYQHLNREKA